MLLKLTAWNFKTLARALAVLISCLEHQTVHPRGMETNVGMSQKP